MNGRIEPPAAALTLPLSFECSRRTQHAWPNHCHRRHSRLPIALRSLLKAIEPSPQDTIVTLGDYVDKGIDSRGVLDLLIDLQGRCRLVALLGNHEEMMLCAREGRGELEKWLQYGGQAALASYDDRERLRAVPEEHWQFLDGCKLFHVAKTHFFAHANYEPHKLLLKDQNRRHLVWTSLRDYVPGPHSSGRIAVVGHTPQDSGEILDLGHLKCIDTNCWQGGWLTALDVESGQVSQPYTRDEKGRPGGG